jgi:chromosome segregation ATPase
MQTLQRTSDDATNDKTNEIQAPQRISGTRRKELNESKPKDSIITAKENCQLCPVGVLSECDDNVTKTVDNARRLKLSRASSFRSVLSESIAASKFSGHSVVSLIENTMANTKMEGVLESKLSQALLENENDHITTEDALVAAVTDMMHMQNNFVEADRKLKDMTERNVSLDTENVALQSELNAMKIEMEALRKSNEELVAQKQKMAANLRKKRDMLTEASNNLSTANTKIESFQNEKGNLLQGIQKLTANRDELKTKLVCKNEISREQRAQVEKLEKRLRITQSIRAKELQLLQHYRQLSLHTGYFKWGKQIRGLEVEVAAALEEEDSDSN